MHIKNILLAIIITIPFAASAQKSDSIKTQNLKDLEIVGFKNIRGIGHMPDVKNGIIYAGKKNEVVIVDSLDANDAINNTRQILGRIPGLNIVETETGGFTANGIGTRGLNPLQSIEMNTRQDGYNISADIYGYNEAYYIPPMNAVQRIEMVRGAASLQFGAQFGGLVNYVIKDAPTDKKFEFTTSQTIGSYGLFNSFNSVGGTYKKLSYYGFLQYRAIQGYRPNSQQWQISGFGKVQYKVSEKLNLGIEYSLLRNQIKMPGGLTDSLFNVSSKMSTRARNWLKSPWNVLTVYANYAPTEATTISLKTTYLFSQRSLVWRNEDGGPQAIDGIDPATNAYAPREVGNEDMKNSTTEFRLSKSYNIGNQKAILSGGLRYAYAWFKRQGGGEGSTGSDFDLSITGDWGYNLDFTTANVAPFVENIFRIGNKLSITPGFRFEYLHSTASGYKTTDDVRQITNENRNRTFPLFGVGLEFKVTSNTNVYGNITQAYRPIDYSQLEPFGTTSKINPNLKDAYGFNSDLGYRGTIKNYLNFDIDAFYLAYDNKIGVVVLTDPSTGNQYSYRTNIANSVHKGIESYIEFNFLKYLNTASKYGLSLFNSFAYVDAKYTSGEYKGNRVEAAAKTINRIGVIFNNSNFSATFQINSVGDAYGDASNVKASTDPIAGYIPAYTVLDFSTTYKIKNYTVQLGANNLTNKSYFTLRTDEYPGPGIIPSIGRSFYIGLTATF
ncbi:TonB-dependent receptor family protein [Arachidicoccus sp.]|uniref:TonB-dependent receptor family protein n=1 Tax=Arachidicoccus sp. TaxID=1872624 RepID=UPI003D2008A7